MKEKTIRGIIIIFLIMVLVCVVYNLGYYKRANDINLRINHAENNQEECFTREEVDFFIYGE